MCKIEDKNSPFRDSTVLVLPVPLLLFLRKNFLKQFYFFIFDNINLDPDPNWAKILDPNPN